MKRRRALLFTFSVVLALCAACGCWLHRERQQYALNRQLIEVLTHNDTKKALALVNAGADPNTRAQPTPAPSFNLLIDQLLHRSPPPVNSSPTALMLACGADWITQQEETDFLVRVKENLPLLQAMLAHGANVNAREENNLTALHEAVRAQHLHSAEMLVLHGADINAQNGVGRTPLMLAIWNDTPNIARMLLTHGENPNVQDANGYTVLYSAIVSPKATTLISDLVAHGADPNLRNKEGLTPLQEAQKEKRPDLVRLLKRSRK
jgi:ankyrin repeat protein